MLTSSFHHSSISPRPPLAYSPSTKNPLSEHNPPGEDGTIETEFVKINIPAVTFEIGHPKVWDKDYIERGKNGIQNYMRLKKMIDGEINASPYYFGLKTSSVRAKVRGLFFGLM